MSKTRLSEQVRTAVVTRAQFRCEYCLTQILISGQAMQIDHIVPEVDGGSSELSNLCLACSSCNLHKASRTAGIDSITHQTALLFNPRQQRWSDHFRWNDGIFVEGITSTGRVTVALLDMNNHIIVNARHVWKKHGLHPPED